MCVCMYVCVYIYIWLRKDYTNYRCYQIILRVKHFCTNRELCEVLAGYLSLGRQPGGDWANTWHGGGDFTVFFSKSSSTYFKFSSLSLSSRTSLEIQGNNYTIIIILCVYNNVIIKEGCKNLLCSSKFPWARERLFSKFTDNLGTRCQKGSPALL